MLLKLRHLYLNLMLKFLQTKFLEIYFNVLNLYTMCLLTSPKKIRTSLAQYLDKYFLLFVSAKQAELVKCLPIHIELRKYSQNFHFVYKTPQKIRRLKYRIYIHGVLTLLLFFQCTFHARLKTDNPLNISDKILSWFCFMLAVLQACFLYSTLVHRSTLEIFLNSILKFSRNLPKTFVKVNKSPLIVESFNLLLVPMLMFSIAVFVPFFVFGFHWTNPCKPSLLGYFLLEECHNSAYYRTDILFLILRGFIKIGVYALNIWMWNFGTFCLCFIASAINLIVPVIFCNGIKMLWDRFQNPGDIYSNSRMYRELQLLNSTYNHVQKHMLGVLILSAIFSISMNSTLLIKCLNGSGFEASSIIMSTFFTAIEDGVAAILLILGGMVEVHKNCKYFLAKVKYLKYLGTSRGARIWARRFWRSCEKLKIKFGDFNFVEELTPLRCLDFTANLTVHMLLLARVTK